MRRDRVNVCAGAVLASARWRDLGGARCRLSVVLVSRDMTAGRIMALAALIFGKMEPSRDSLACLWLSEAVQIRLQGAIIWGVTRRFRCNSPDITVSVTIDAPIAVGPDGAKNWSIKP